MTVKGKLKAISRELEARRLKGENISFKDHLASLEATPEKVYRELGINPMRTTVQQLMDMDQDTRWLFPEVVRDAIIVGMNIGAIHQDLVIADEPINGTTATMPYFDVSDMKSTKSRTYKKGETIDEDEIVAGEKRVGTKKRAKRVNVPYESIRFATLNTLAAFLKGVGARLNKDISALGTDTLINGDGGVDEDGNAVESAPATIGVASTENGIVFIDYSRGVLRMSKISRPVTSMLGDETEMLNVMGWDEFSSRAVGAALTQLNMKTPLPSMLNGFVSDDVPSGKLLLVAKDYAMMQFTSQPLMVESDKIIARQLKETVVSIITGFGILHRNGRVVINGAVAYASNGFPTWMNV